MLCSWFRWEIYLRKISSIQRCISQLRNFIFKIPIFQFMAFIWLRCGMLILPTWKPYKASCKEIKTIIFLHALIILTQAKVGHTSIWSLERWPKEKLKTWKRVLTTMCQNSTMLHNTKPKGLKLLSPSTHQALWHFY